MLQIRSKADFDAFVARIEGQEGYRRPLAFGVGLVRLNAKCDTRLDAFFPFPNFNENFGTAAVLAHILGHMSGTASYHLNEMGCLAFMSRFAWTGGDGLVHRNVDAVQDLRSMLLKSVREVALTVVFIDQPEHDPGPKTVEDAYLRLHLLSSRKVKPNGIKLDGIFSALPIVAHTSEGPIALDELEKRRQEAMVTRTPLHIYDVDRFPRMVDYVVPSGVRIADASRVRLGAHLGEGTVVMHEGFVNFNAGTLGKSMVEGRISSGVVVGDQTDIGGGASIMGTLSGGGKEVITIGRGCLIGANAGTGISLGDLCVIEAGLYVTAGMPVVYRGGLVKAKLLSGMSGLTFRRDSAEGVVEALEIPNKVTLNDILHAH